MNTFTEEEILDRGTRAAAVLNNADVTAFIEEERALLLEALSNTAPHETKTREALYYQHYAIGEFMKGLRQHVDAGIAVIKRYEAAETADEDISD